MQDKENLLDISKKHVEVQETKVMREFVPKKKDSIAELLKFVFFALLIIVPLRAYVAQPFVVNGASMHPAFESAEYLIIDEFTYHFNDPKRGDVIVFRYPNNPKDFYIKRVIGLPGENIEIKGKNVRITNDMVPGGFILEEPYIGEMGAHNLSMNLGEDEYFVMGDNRLYSSDSRSWGAVPEKNIVGRAYLRLLPLSRIDFLPGEFDLYLN